MNFLFSFPVFIVLLGTSSGQNIGDSCTYNSDCPIAHSSCLSSYCTCDANFIPKNDMTECLEIREFIGDPCVQREQCQLGEPGPLSTCTDSRCQCNSNAVHAPNKHKCLPKATRIDDACEIYQQCVDIGRSKCEGNKCICNDEGVPSSDGTKCLQKLSLGASCDPQEPRQCNHVLNAICSAPRNICACNPGYIPNINNERCLKEASLIGDECEVDDQCAKLEGSICNVNEKKCGCKSENIESDKKDKCVPKINRLKEECTDSNQCQVPGSDCLLDSTNATKKSCLCDSSHIQDGNICIKAQSLGGPCDSDLECSKIGYGGTVKCHPISKICACPVTEPPSRFFNERCVKPALLNETCDNHDSCMLGVNKLTFCVGNPLRCRCPESALEKEGKCWAQLRVGSNCLVDEECRQTIFGPVRCADNKCMCDPGFPANKDGFRCAGSSLDISKTHFILTVLVTIFTTIKFGK